MRNVKYVIIWLKKYKGIFLRAICLVLELMEIIKPVIAIMKEIGLIKKLSVKCLISVSIFLLKYTPKKAF